MLDARTLQSLAHPGWGFALVSPDRLRYDADWTNGRLLIWELPKAGSTYVLGCDVAEGREKDRSVIEVVRRGTLTTCDEQVAEWASDTHDVVEFADIIATIGRFYCEDDRTEALAIVEANGPGDTVVNDLRGRLNYQNQFIWKVFDRITKVTTNRFGWYTNDATRRKLIARFQHAFAKGDIRLHSDQLFEEMEDFQASYYGARAAAMAGKHDDRVMAIMMAFWGAHDEEWLAGEDLAEQRRLLTTAASRQQTLAEQSIHASHIPRVDYQNTPVTADAMWELGGQAFDDWFE